MGVLDTILVFTVYSLNFLLFFGAVCVLYVTMSENRQKDIQDNFEIDFEFFLLFTKFMFYIALIVAIISFLGCFGIAIDNDYMLMAYVAILALVILIKIALVIYVVKNIDLSNNEIKNKITKLVKETSSEKSNAMDAIQSKHNCCGFDGPNDWFKTPRASIPGSCCKKKPEERCTSVSVYGKPGCNVVITEKLTSLIGNSFKVIFIVFGIEVLLVLASILILLDVGQQPEESYIDVVHIGHFKEGLSKDENTRFEESIDTHDSIRTRMSEGEVILNRQDNMSIIGS